MMSEDEILDTSREHKPMDDYPTRWFKQYHRGDLTDEEMYTLMCEFRQQAQARWQAQESPDQYPSIVGHIRELEAGDNRDSRNEIAAEGAVDLAEYA